MGYVVAITARRELGQHLGRVRSHVAGRTLRHHLMGVGVAESAIESTVGSFAGLQQVEGIAVTSGAVRRCNTVVIDHRHRLVRLVTLGTFGHRHSFGMRIMAV